MPQTAALPRVTILMATRDGAAHLGAQLASIVAQDHPHWALRISDDGSTDGTRALLRAFADAHPGHDIRLVEGPRRGSAAANFLSLLCDPDLGPGPVALADQDDVWYPARLSRGLAALQGVEGPAVWSAQSRHIAADGRPIGPSRVHRGAPSFGNALVQNRVAGHCATLNPAALALVRAAGPVTVPFHDWWLYQLVAGAGGQVIVSDEIMLDYRQHGRNVLGGNRRRLAGTRRALQVLGPVFRDWMAQNRAALETALPLLTPEARRLLGAFDAAPRAGPGRVAALRRLGILRDAPGASAFLQVAAFFGRL